MSTPLGDEIDRLRSILKERSVLEDAATGASMQHYIVWVNGLSFRVCGTPQKDGTMAISSVEVMAPYANIWLVLEGTPAGERIQSEADQKAREENDLYAREMKATGGLGYGYECEGRN